MKKVLQMNSKRQERKNEVKTLEQFEMSDSDVKIALIQSLIPIALLHVEDVLKKEVSELAGKRYKRDGLPGHSRWTRQKGFVYLSDQKVPVIYQRVRDTINNKEVPLPSYEKLQQPRDMDEQLLRKILFGLSCRNYRMCSEAIPEAFSMSHSTVSRRFIKASSRKLKELLERDLSQHDFVGVIMDGKGFGEDEILVALGITMQGEKVVLGIIQAPSENSTVCADFLQSLVERGLRYDQGLFIQIDGSKGIRKAVRKVFGKYGFIQRCQWHKRENVLNYLPKRLRNDFRKKLQRAYDKDTYEEARKALFRVRNELRLINASAVNSLDEGLDETLTIYKLGLGTFLKKSFRTTNMIESVMSQIARKTDKVAYWKNSDQKQRWVATALLFIEKKLNKVNGYRHLPMLRQAMQKKIDEEEGRKEARIA